MHSKRFHPATDKETVRTHAIPSPRSLVRKRSMTGAGEVSAAEAEAPSLPGGADEGSVHVNHHKAGGACRQLGALLDSLAGRRLSHVWRQSQSSSTDYKPEDAGSELVGTCRYVSS
jgi:hypothetical protein